MTDPQVRQQAIDTMTGLLLQGGQGQATEADCREAATKLVDREIRLRGQISDSADD